MAKAGSLFVSLALDSARYAAGLSDTTRKTNKTVRNIQRQLKGLVNFAVGAGGLYAIVRGFGAVTTAMAAQEEATNRLSISLRNNFEFTNRNLRAMQDQAGALQLVTRFGDEAINTAQAQLMAIGQLTAELTMNATPALLDFATGLGIDLSTAAELLGKTLGGTTNLLTRYSIQVDITKDASGRLEDAIKGINDQWKDVSQIKGYTTEVERLKGVYGDLFEEIGFSVTGQAGGIFSGVAEMFRGIATNMKAVRIEAENLRKYLPEGPQGRTINEGFTTIFYTDDQMAKMNTAIDAENKAQEDANKSGKGMALYAKAELLQQELITKNKKAQAEWQMKILSLGTGPIIPRIATRMAAPGLSPFRSKDIRATDWYKADQAARIKATEDETKMLQDIWDEGNKQYEDKQKVMLDNAEMNFNDYAWNIEDTWSRVIQGMITDNNAFAINFKNMIKVMWQSMAGVIADRAAYTLGDMAFDLIKAIPGVSWVANLGGRETDAGLPPGFSETPEDVLSISHKSAVGPIYINGPSADAIISIVASNQADNGILR